MKLQFVIRTLLLSVQYVLIVTASRLTDKVYEPITGTSCFRRMNGTHQTGCASSFSGSVGALHLIQKQQDFEFLLQSPPAPPYAPMIPPFLFTRQNLLRLKNEGKQNISVVLLINRTDKMTQFSHELNCPNQYSGIVRGNSTETTTCDARQPETSWNPWGTGLLHEDFPFPIYYISEEEEIQKLINCYVTFNNYDYEAQGQRRLCAVQVNAFMTGAVSSEVCMRRTNIKHSLSRVKYCDPLEGRNVFATLFPRAPRAADEPRKEMSHEKFILVTSRLDTTAMFDGVGMGAMDSLTGFATLVAAGHMLARILPDTSLLLNKNHNVLFVLFNGESYDYIGSQRFVFDLENFYFSMHTAPITLQNIELMVDIGTINDVSSIKVHTVAEFKQSVDFIRKLQNYAGDSKYGFQTDFQSVEGLTLPPTSAQSFLRKNLSFPAMILNSPPTNKYYHSIYDDANNLNFTYANTSRDFSILMNVEKASRYFASDSVQMKIRDVSSVIAMALYQTLTGRTYEQYEVVNPVLIDEFLHCFLESANCSLFRAASPPGSLPGLPIPPLRYISVANGPQESSGWTHRLVGYLFSQIVNIPKENCSGLPLRWLAGVRGQGECHLTTQNYSAALSPAFLMDDYDWKSGEYSTWTESTWMQFSARIFLRPSRPHETLTLTVGIVMFVLSFCMVYLISNRSDVLFDTDSASSSDRLASPTAL